MQATVPTAHPKRTAKQQLARVPSKTPLLVPCDALPFLVKRGRCFYQLQGMGPLNRHWGCSDPWQSRWKWEFRSAKTWRTCAAHQVSGNVFGVASWLGLSTCCTPRVWSGPHWHYDIRCGRSQTNNCLNFHCFSNNLWFSGKWVVPRTIQLASCLMGL